VDEDEWREIGNKRGDNAKVSRARFDANHRGSDASFGSRIPREDSRSRKTLEEALESQIAPACQGSIELWLMVITGRDPGGWQGDCETG
jgi:hypothetical protein